MNDIVDSLVIPIEKIRKLDLKRFIISKKDLIKEDQYGFASLVCPFDNNYLILALSSQMRFNYKGKEIICPTCERKLTVTKMSDDSFLIETEFVEVSNV